MNRKYYLSYERRKLKKKNELSLLKKLVTVQYDFDKFVECVRHSPCMQYFEHVTL